MTNPTFTQRLANPTRFMEISARVLPWLSGAAGLLIAYALYLAFFVAPDDYQQGQTVKIMFIHVPAAWLSMMGYGLIAASSFGLLVFRHPLADVSAKAAAPIGAAFTALALITGSLWGKPMWGTYWVWDARLTSVLILFFLYLGLMALRSSIEDETLAAKLTAILGLVGVAILPFIKISVEGLHIPSLGIIIPAWNTLHQPSSVLKSGGPSIHPDLLRPLLDFGARVYDCVLRHAHQGHAKRDPAPPRQSADHGRSCARRARRSNCCRGVNTWTSDRTPHLSGSATRCSPLCSPGLSPGWSSMGAARRRPSPISKRAASNAALPSHDGEPSIAAAARPRLDAGAAHRLRGHGEPLCLRAAIRRSFEAAVGADRKACTGTQFAPIDGLLDAGVPVPGFAGADLAKGKVSVVNFWATWCIPCIQEHPLLMQLKQQTGVDIYGVNHKDDPTAARRFLGCAAIHSPRPASTRKAAVLSSGASTACRKLSSSMAKARLPTSTSGR